MFTTINKPVNFDMLEDGTKLSIVLNLPENCNQTAKFVADAQRMRSKIINRS